MTQEIKRRIGRATKIIQEQAFGGMSGFKARLIAERIVRMIERSIKRSA